ncbi:hypothetical protein JVT61DRAFT_14806 [Boletus reticuloceps]|uniref:Uncharacterized protein n=1 Tax=Boletus reticuloceps TaxID=495285 RepID=A0A8I3AAH2_9AGAM|nr:hypothetical protein JVT61DRAFT_14806 [Boletus reticuloceps]
MARVSKADFAPGSNQRAYSCGFDSTVQTWDVELGVCTDTITVPERPMLDLAVTPDGHTVLASSTDLTVSIFDLRSPSLASTTGTLLHPATPSCLRNIVTIPDIERTSSPDRRLRRDRPSLDLRSLKSAVCEHQRWDGSPKKILSIDWVGEVVGVAGEGGVEVWRVGQGDRVLSGIK